MIDVEFKFDGDKKLVENLKKINRTASGRALRRAAKQGAEVIVQEAKHRAPVDTGLLRKSIRSKFMARRSESVTVEIGPSRPIMAISWSSALPRWPPGRFETCG